MDRQQRERPVGMDDPLWLHEGLGIAMLDGERGQRPVTRLAHDHRGLDRVAVLALPGMAAFLALELGHVQRQRNTGLALDELDVVRDVVLGRLEADAAWFDSLR